MANYDERIVLGAMADVASAKKTGEEIGRAAGDAATNAFLASFNAIFDKIPVSNKKVAEYPFPRIPYEEAMLKYGSDKPDLRNPLIIQDVTKVFENTEFNAFKDKTVKAIVVPNGAEQGRKFFDSMAEFAVNECEAKGLAWTKFEKDGTVQGGIAKFINEDAKEKLEEFSKDCYEKIIETKNLKQRLNDFLSPANQKNNIKS